MDGEGRELWGLVGVDEWLSDGVAELLGAYGLVVLSHVKLLKRGAAGRALARVAQSFGFFLGEQFNCLVLAQIVWQVAIEFTWHV